MSIEEIHNIAACSKNRPRPYRKRSLLLHLLYLRRQSHASMAVHAHAHSPSCPPQSLSIDSILLSCSRPQSALSMVSTRLIFPRPRSDLSTAHAHVYPRSHPRLWPPMPTPHMPTAAHAHGPPHPHPNSSIARPYSAAHA